jgi:hypothetical protein
MTSVGSSGLGDGLRVAGSASAFGVAIFSFAFAVDFFAGAFFAAGFFAGAFFAVVFLVVFFVAMINSFLHRVSDDFNRTPLQRNGAYSFNKN